MRDDLEFEIKSSELDSEGRFILINAIVQGSDCVLINVYAPNKVQEQCAFFNDLRGILSESGAKLEINF